VGGVGVEKLLRGRKHARIVKIRRVETGFAPGEGLRNLSPGGKLFERPPRAFRRLTSLPACIKEQLPDKPEENHVKPHYILAGSLAATVTVLDQLSKYLVQQHLTLYASTTVIPGFFNLVHTLNRGAAFGFQNSPDGTWQPYFFIAVSVLAVVIILNLLSKADHGSQLFVVALGLILGGAVGNLIDRVRLGEVIDFLEFYLGSFVWPAFNVADIAITLGSMALILSFYTRKRG
jgi:signal peptidase II